MDSRLIQAPRIDLDVLVRLNEKVITKGVKSGSISWTGFKEDGEGKYTVPILSEQHYQIARAIEAHCRGGAAS